MSVLRKHDSQNPDLPKVKHRQDLRLSNASDAQSPNPHNPEQKLEQQRDWYSAGAGFTTMAAAATMIFTPLQLLGLISLPFALLMIEEVARAGRALKLAATTRVVVALEEAFPQQTEITYGVPVEGQNDLDLFVRFPEARISFAFLVRATGQGQAYYNERTETICLKRNGGITRYNKPDLITLMKDQEHWLRRNRRDLFGGSSKDSRRPLVRILVFAKPTELREHLEPLYAIISDQRFLQIRNSKGSTYLLSEDQVISFIKAYLAQNIEIA